MQIDQTIKQQIATIDWGQYQSAYGNVNESIPKYLESLFSQDKQIVIEATGKLWTSLCHQHAYVSSAALPAYDVIMNKFIKADDEVKVELLDIFYGFAVCTNGKEKLEKSSFEYQLRQKLINDIEIYKALTNNPNEQISNFAELIVEQLA